MSSMPEYPNPETWEYAGPRQARRAARSFDVLRCRAVPVYPWPLFITDDEQVVAQPAQDTMRRVAVLWAVKLRADGYTQDEVLGLIEQENLWDIVSARERTFLEKESPTAEDCEDFTWRLESIWALLWALGYVEQLDWPSRQCDVPAVIEIFGKLDADAEFITAATLRPVAELLDARDLIMRIHWAIRDAYLHRQQMIPEDLNWSGESELVHLSECEGVIVVEERHRALSWLLDADEAQDWDHVDTST
jgi:hypothetical protein